MLITLATRSKLRHHDNPWWAMQSFRDNLHEVSRFVLNDKNSKKRHKSLQSKIAAQITRIIIPTTLAESLSTTLHKFIAPLAFLGNTTSDTLRLSIQAAKSLPPSLGFAMVKTW